MSNFDILGRVQRMTDDAHRLVHDIDRQELPRNPPAALVMVYDDMRNAADDLHNVLSMPGGYTAQELGRAMSIANDAYNIFSGSMRGGYGRRATRGYESD